MSRTITIEKADFGVCRIAAQLLAATAEKAVKACNLAGANNDAAEDPEQAVSVPADPRFARNRRGAA